MDRRKALKVLGTAPIAASVVLEPASPQATSAQTVAPAAAATPASSYAPQFFTAREWDTVRLLVDMIIPADARSGSATDAGVPEFMDFIMTDRPAMGVPMRGGLAWLDVHSRKRTGRPFVEATDAERRGILDEIAYPDQAAPGLSHGVAFFTGFRDLTASGFWTTKAGMEDLGYRGNTYVQQWDGAPQEEVDRLGLSYDDWIVR